MKETLQTDEMDGLTGTVLFHVKTEMHLIERPGGDSRAEQTGMS